MYYSIIYQSIAQDDLKESEIDNMLLRAKRHNKSNNITGCIVYHNDKFIQLIQGSKNAIDGLYGKIKADNRHYKVITLLESASEAMLWEEWYMAILKFSGNSEQNKYNRIILESYLESANSEQKSSEVYRVFKTNVVNLLNEK